MSNSVESDTRLVYARRMFSCGFGSWLVPMVFEAYLARIPPVPESLIADDPNFSLLVLGEPYVGLTRACQLIDLDYNGDNDTFVLFNQRCHAEPRQPWWFRMNTGRLYDRSRMPMSEATCHATLAPNEIYATALRGAYALLHYPNMRQEGLNIGLLGSVSRTPLSSPFGYHARLDTCGTGPRLYTCGGAFDYRETFGSSATCRES